MPDQFGQKVSCFWLDYKFVVIRTKVLGYNSGVFQFVVALFTETNGNKIGRLDPATGFFTEWTLPTAISSPRGIAVSGGLVYFT